MAFGPAIFRHGLIKGIKATTSINTKIFQPYYKDSKPSLEIGHSDYIETIVILKTRIGRTAKVVEPNIITDDVIQHITGERETDLELKRLTRIFVYPNAELAQIIANDNTSSRYAFLKENGFYRDSIYLDKIK